MCRFFPDKRNSEVVNHLLDYGEWVDAPHVIGLCYLRKLWRKHLSIEFQPIRIELLRAI